MKETKKLRTAVGSHNRELTMDQNEPKNKWKTIKKTIIKMIHGIIEMTIRGILRFVYGSSAESMPPIKDLILLESASSLAYKIRTKKLTSVQVLDSFIARIEEINPLLNCVVDKRFADAKLEAKKADELIDSGVLSEEVLAKEKPFLGVPFTTKDCIQVKDLCHTAGLYKRRHIIGTEDGAAIALLRKAGAIPIALTNVSELCMWWESNNIVHGKTNNPYDINRIVGGSSGGEGCIQAACGSAFGIGSDIGGSIRMPAFFNGVFGHKASPFIVSNKGQYPFPVNEEQGSFLAIGPMCRRAEDLMPIFKIIADKNVGKLRLNEPVDIKKIRFFYQESDTGGVLVSPVDKDIKNAIRLAVLHLEKAHKLKPERVMFKQFSKSAAMWFANMKAKDSPTFSEQLANLDGSINIGWELVKWFVGQSEHTFIGLATALMEKWGVEYGSSEYEYLVSLRNNFKRDLIDLLGVDGVLLYPTHPTAAPYHYEPLIKPFNFSYTGVINVLGLPATHIPLGLGSEGVPIGFQVIAAPDQDRLCLAVALELEKAFGGWVPPPIEA